MKLLNLAPDFLADPGVRQSSWSILTATLTKTLTLFRLNMMNVKASGNFYCSRTFSILVSVNSSEIFYFGLSGRSISSMRWRTTARVPSGSNLRLISFSEAFARHPKSSHHRLSSLFELGVSNMGIFRGGVLSTIFPGRAG